MFKGKKWLPKPPKIRKKAGRKSSYTKEKAAEICQEIATTARGLVEICEANVKFPKPATIYRWLMENPEFREMYGQAKEDQLQVLADQIIPIADTPKLGQIVTIKADGTREIKALDMTHHRQMQIDARKWILAKLCPRKYGDRQAITGPDDGPLQVALTPVEEMSLPELMAELKKKLSDGDPPRNQE